MPGSYARSSMNAFTQYLLSLAFSVNLEPDVLSVNSSTSAFPVDHGSTLGDNNDGITVLDISDPLSPSYCFVSIYGLSIHDQEAASEDVPELVPLSAKTYVRAYYPEEETSSSEENEEVSALEERSVQGAIRSLDPYPVISLQTLHATWPDEYELEGEMEVETQSNTIPAAAALDNDNDVALPLAPSLVDAIFRRAVETAIATNTIDELESFLNDEEKVCAMKDILRARKPIEDGAPFLLLQRLLQVDLHSKCIDLSSLHLSKDQIQMLFREQSWLESVEHIDVSGLIHFDIDVLRELVGCLPNLRHINLWNTAVTGYQLQDLLDREPDLFYRIERLIHPIFFDRSESSVFAPALSFVVVKKRPRHKSPIMTSLPYFTPSQLVQGFLDIFGPILTVRKQGEEDPFRDLALLDHMLWTGAFASEARPQGAPWSQRAIPYIPSYASENFHARQWLFVLDVEMEYAFGRFIPEVGQLLSAEIKAMNETNETTFRAEVNKVVDRLKAEHGGLFELFDVRAFFDALKEEGRLPPDPQALNRLLKYLRSCRHCQAEHSAERTSPASRS
ncbi:hypothetical protein D9613_004888 [Agrocybe pediades]|uniref:Uncharacterized protein n=1 Tax=Agrocybe pediades TaxID=84607 RepID=A0A8H4VT31_9AGAR|nr:hypothetical protein D9613_004888 [Agrocybe pediades]